MSSLLGIDIGTSACKVAAFSETGATLASETVEYTVGYPAEGYAEQDPELWFSSVCRALRSVTDKVGAENIAGVGVDGQSWSCILCGRDGSALAPSPIWFDRRAEAECDDMKRAVGAERIFACCGNPVEPVYTTPKALWFKKRAPELYARTYKILQSNSYIVMKLTGAFTQDVSQGYGHAFFDMAKRGYDVALAAELGFEPSMYPDVYGCSDVVGRVTREAAGLTGLREGTPVVAGGLDAACGTLGAGVYESGQTQEQSGTAGGMSVCVGAPVAHPKLILCPHVVDGMYLLQGGTSGGGGSLKWFEQQFGASFTSESGYRFGAIDSAAASVPRGSDGVVFLPYMAGERSPIWDSRAKGVWFGLSYSTGRAHMARALLEGVAYSLRHNLETALEAGARADTLYPSGGAARSDLWMQIKADVTGKRFAVPEVSDATALGAAMLAGVGVGVWSSCGEAVRDIVRVKRVYEPDPSGSAAYDAGYAKYRALYESIKHLY